MIKEVNNLDWDEFGRPSGILAVDKPAGMTSHDIVNQLRHILNTKKVGHVGALDVFATGVMIYLVGKSTKLSEKLMHMDKAYVTKILLGVATDTQDPEGKITELKTGYRIEELDGIEKIVESFKGEYDQYVSIYSSVKVNGQKLRKLMRTEGYEKQVMYDSENNKTLIMTPKAESNLKPLEIKIPKRKVSIFEISLLEKGNIGVEALSKIKDDFNSLPSSQKFPFIKISVETSKGTYIRQLSEDIGAKLDMPAMLINLTRTRVGNIMLEDCVSVNDFEKRFLQNKK